MVAEKLIQTFVLQVFYRNPFLCIFLQNLFEYFEYGAGFS